MPEPELTLNTEASCGDSVVIDPSLLEPPPSECRRLYFLVCLRPLLLRSTPSAVVQFTDRAYSQQPNIFFVSLHSFITVDLCHCIESSLFSSIFLVSIVCFLSPLFFLYFYFGPYNIESSLFVLVPVFVVYCVVMASLSLFFSLRACRHYPGSFATTMENSRCC